MTTMNKGAESVSQKLRWFFTSEESRYELAEVTRISRSSRDSIQNWVRRDMIKPDETTPGRRIYHPLTVADIKVAAQLVEMNVSPYEAFAAARVVNIRTMGWFAGNDWIDGDEMPAFRRDLPWLQFAALSWAPSRLYPDPRRVNVDIEHRDNLGKYLSDGSPIVFTVFPIGRFWIDLADFAQHLKQRKGKRLKDEND